MRKKRYDFLSGRDTEKFCNTCKQIKPISEYEKHRFSSTGYRPICRRCRAKEKNAWEHNQAATLKGRIHNWKKSAKKRRIEWKLEETFFCDMPLTCSYTGQQLTCEHDKPNTISLDRLDSSNGYLPGNVCFTSAVINRMKNDVVANEFIAICEMIANYKKKP